MYAHRICVLACHVQKLYCILFCICVSTKCIYNFPAQVWLRTDKVSSCRIFHFGRTVVVQVSLRSLAHRVSLLSLDTVRKGQLRFTVKKQLLSKGSKVHVTTDPARGMVYTDKETDNDIIILVINNAVIK